MLEPLCTGRPAFCRLFQQGVFFNDFAFFGKIEFVCGDFFQSLDSVFRLVKRWLLAILTASKPIRVNPAEVPAC